MSIRLIGYLGNQEFGVLGCLVDNRRLTTSCKICILSDSKALKYHLYRTIKGVYIHYTGEL